MKILTKGRFAHPFSVTPDDTLRLEWHKHIKVGKRTRSFRRIVLAETRIPKSDTYDSYIFFSVDNTDIEFDSNSGIGAVCLNRQGRVPWDKQSDDTEYDVVEKLPGWARRLWDGEHGSEVEEV